MFKIFSLILLAMSTCCSLANEPISVTISGPHKIFTNDIVNYSASVSGAQNVSYSWNISYGSESSSGGSLELTAPSTPTIIILQCTASSGTGNNTITDTATKQVIVVEPVISITRIGLTDFDNISGADDIYVGSNETAYLKKNGLFVPADMKLLTINIQPSDVDVQNLSLTTSMPEELQLHNRSNFQKLLLPHPETNCKISDVSILTNLCVNAPEQGFLTQVKLTINGVERVSVNYYAYGIQSSAFEFPSQTDYDFCTNRFPNLIDNEWALAKNSSNPHFNCLAYAIKQPPVFNNKNFAVYDVDFLNTNFDFTNLDTAFRLLPDQTMYWTAIDFFGNNNRRFDEPDIDLFFKHTYWGPVVTQYANNFNDSFILYYNERNNIVSWRCHAARRSSRTLGCHSDWNMFESKMGKLKILMHRAEQLEDGIYGIVWRKYK